jgi:hypothetical protein
MFSGTEVIEMPYKILCWIPVEEDEPEIYERKLDALVDLRSIRLMQPENIYKIVKFDEGD